MLGHRVCLFVAFFAIGGAVAWAQGAPGQSEWETNPEAITDRFDEVVDELNAALQLDEAASQELNELVARYREYIAEYQADGPDAVTERARGELDEANKAGDKERAAELSTLLRLRTSAGLVSSLLRDVREVVPQSEHEKIAEIQREASSQSKTKQVDPAKVVERLRRDLKLRPDQTSAFDAAVAEMEQAGKQGSLGEDELMEIVAQLQAAAESGDEGKVEELRERVLDSRESPLDALEAFMDKIAPSLDEAQKQTLERHRRRFLDRAGRSDLNPTLLIRLAKRARLAPEQRAELRIIEREAREAERALRRDKEGLAKLSGEVEEKIRALLDEQQTAEFEKLIERYQR